MLGALRAVAMIEGVSYLLLLGVAMPLKYFAGMPMAVKVAGWIHGALFVVFCLLLAAAWRKVPLSFWLTVQVFIASLLPFGPFVIDKKLKHSAPA
jgi:integral membrane protein